jgi:ubiquinone/menaquinone biosynthesis C-methylase UbiE/DNA-binding transcriptional ArsR family regulator
VDLRRYTALLKVLADPTRLRLLTLLQLEELSVAELAVCLQLAQPRISTHLAKLKEVKLVQDRRAGVSSFYRVANNTEQTVIAIWQDAAKRLHDDILQTDLQQMHAVLRQRNAGGSWADLVAGDMERHYSPGRTWEALARSFVHLLNVGDVLDIACGDGALAEIIAPNSRSYTGVDLSPKVVEAANRRTEKFANAKVIIGDMHRLAFADNQFDLIMLMQALPYAEDPTNVFAEASRCLRSGARLVGTTLAKHEFANAVQPFGHSNNGFDPSALSQLMRDAKLNVLHCAIEIREKRPPHFRVITFLAEKP